MNVRILFAVTALLAAGAGAAAAQQPTQQQTSTKTTTHTTHKTTTHTHTAPAAHGAAQVSESRPGLTAQAKVGMEDARKAALASYANGEVVGSKLERRGGKLVYVFRIRPAGQKRVRVVMVDANTGTVVASRRSASRKGSSSGHAHGKG